MLADKKFNYSYSQVDQHLPSEFCTQALSNSLKLDLGLGYFSSASFNVLALGMAKFISNGGVMNLYINKYISLEDYKLLKNTNHCTYDNDITRDFRFLKQTFEERDEHFFRCLSYLIQNKRINVRIVLLSNGGLPHEKYGIFTDECNNKIYFNGSMNLTANAILGNLETIECTCSWQGKDSYEKVICFEEHFNKIWNGESEGVKIYDAHNFCNEIMKSYPDQNLDLLIKKEQDFIEEFNIGKNRNKQKPHFPEKYKNGPLPYQIDAYNAWIHHNKMGVFAMATGTGKTATSLYCALNEYNTDGYYNILILVPTLDLVEQWQKDLNEFNFKKHFCVSSLNSRWRSDLMEIANKVKRGKICDFVIISTYDSFVHKDFQYILKILSKNTILIADEAHNIGGALVRRCFEDLTISRRIALSATPERIYDDESCKGIGTFFNDKWPYTFSFPMSKAISEKRLCPYYYYPKIAYLDEEEMGLYSFYTQKLVSLWDDIKQQFTNKKEAELLLMNRKRIIHKCKDKIRVYQNILREIGENKLKYTFVYAPQGKFTQSHNLLESRNIDDEDISFINKLLYITKETFPNLRCSSFTGMDSKTTRSDLLKAFDDGTIDILIAMKCLDEGVNIPRAEVGIFTSSTGNPREYIQRRGRLLRTHESKTYSYIYDIIVIPETINRENSFSSMESNLVRAELKRVAYFAALAQNCMANNGAYEVLYETAQHFGIIWSDLFTNIEQ